MTRAFVSCESQLLLSDVNQAQTFLADEFGSIDASAQAFSLALSFSFMEYARRKLAIRTRGQ